MIIASEAKNFPFIVKMSSNEKKIKKQHKVFSIHEIMQMLTNDAHVGTWVDLAAMLSLSVLTLNMIVSKWYEIKKSYSHCGLSFCTEWKSLKTLPLEQLETILLAWFKQVCTANTSIDGSHQKLEVPHVATHLGIDSFWASNGWINHYKKRHNLVYKTMLEESATVNPETVIDWKSEKLPKIVNRYQPKDIFLILMKLDSFIISSQVRHWHTKVILVKMEQNQSRGSLFC